MSNTNRTPIIYNGVEYKSVRSACIELGLNYSIISNRMWRYSLSFEEAVDYNSRKVSYNDVEYKSRESACVELGFSYDTIRYRMRKSGLSSEETIDFYNAKRDFDILKKYFAINDTVTSKEGLFIDCTCNKCNIKAILGVDTMRKHIEVCYAE